MHALLMRCLVVSVWPGRWGRGNFTLQQGSRACIVFRNGAAPRSSYKECSAKTALFSTSTLREPTRLHCTDASSMAPTAASDITATTAPPAFLSAPDPVYEYSYWKSRTLPPKNQSPWRLTRPFWPGKGPVGFQRPPGARALAVGHWARDAPRTSAAACGALRAQPTPTRILRPSTVVRLVGW